jgi:hypothetical protein
MVDVLFLDTPESGDGGLISPSTGPSDASKTGDDCNGGAKGELRRH